MLSITSSKTAYSLTHLTPLSHIAVCDGHNLFENHCICLSIDEILIGSTLHSLDIDLTKLPANQRQLYTHSLDQGYGQLVFLVTLTPCSGASISDIQTAPLDDPKTFERMQEQYVGITYYFSFLLFFIDLFLLPSNSM